MTGKSAVNRRADNGDGEPPWTEVIVSNTISVMTILESPHNGKHDDAVPAYFDIILINQFIIKLLFWLRKNTKIQASSEDRSYPDSFIPSRTHWITGTAQQVRTRPGNSQSLDRLLYIYSSRSVQHLALLAIPYNLLVWWRVLIR